VGDVDFTDIVLLITLQLFESNVFERVFAGIEELAGENISFEKDEHVAARYEPTNANNPKAAKRALAHLFPQLAKGWNEHIWDGVPFLKKQEQRRICTKYYRNYFLFGRDPDRISRGEIESILADASPNKRMSDLIAKIAKSESRRGVSRVAVFLDQLSELTFSKPILSNGVVSALLDLSDQLILREDRVWELFVEDNLERLISIFTFGLVPLGQPERDERLQILKSNSAGVTLACVIMSRLAGQHGLAGGPPLVESERLIGYDSALSGMDSVAKKIRVLADQGLLLRTPRPILLIFIWRQIVGVDEVKAWIVREMESDDSVLLLAQKLPSTSFRTSGDGRSEIRSFKASTYEEILDIDHFKRRLASVVAANPNSVNIKSIQSGFLDAERIGYKE
jgi:hypothetical protein